MSEEIKQPTIEEYQKTIEQQSEIIASLKTNIGSISAELRKLKKERDSEPVFEGVKIDGKEFPFVQVTFSQKAKIQRMLDTSYSLVIQAFIFSLLHRSYEKSIKAIQEKYKQGIAEDVLKAEFFEATAKFDASWCGRLASRMITHSQMVWWGKIRNVAFEKNRKWKIFRITPKELCDENISIVRAAEVKKNFLAYYEAKAKEFGELWNYSITSTPTKTNTQA